jgi:hypothetical protein
VERVQPRTIAAGEVLFNDRGVSQIPITVWDTLLE